MKQYPDLSRFDMVAIDIESTGLVWWKDKIFGISIATPDMDSYYWDIRNDSKVINWLKSQINETNWVGHNFKFDMHFLYNIGIQFRPDNIKDIMVRAALLNEFEPSYSLDSLANKYLKKKKHSAIWNELAGMFGGVADLKSQIKNLSRAPSSVVDPYAREDALLAMELYKHQQDGIESEALTELESMESRLLYHLFVMERRGVRVDINRCENSVKELAKAITQKQKELDDIAGFKVNPNPSSSIHELFKPKQIDGDNFVLIDGTSCPATPKGKASINSLVLSKMSHPAAEIILQLRRMKKAKDTFLEGHILSHHDNGVIHCNYNQTKSDTGLGTSTGRLSVNRPALQQIHKRNKDIASIVRACFVPLESDMKWLCYDWSQMDFRMFAHYVNNDTILKKYSEDKNSDYHQIVADLTSLPRSAEYTGQPNAKQINLGLVFGMGQGRLAMEMGLPYEIRHKDGKSYLWPGPEAEELFERYHESIPGVRDLLKRASSIAKSRGYIKTYLGRRIRFKSHYHKAAGLLFQGSAADCLKQKIVELNEYLESEGDECYLVLNVHDEFDINMTPDRKMELEIKRILEDFNFRVPIVSDYKIGENWYDASN